MKKVLGVLLVGGSGLWLAAWVVAALLARGLGTETVGTPPESWSPSPPAPAGWGAGFTS